ncbi:ABC transporter substrate-binding protein [Tropicimonas sediminicola]|uniref:Amino acid/amide ABC transporter substrate-binding protein, HAAT family n=1 Tax=Tropicimonas sediminicola TaxID=1031541 RepID=A0A239K744_9RHOB|nr:ABC transporter substrate-binding protein [Tropicimonas sediminicola]SNT12994.1 amino acid/amide ABC transporter substrate-binding protein, HAAT family [Tropicimonas sediminicola]
MSSSSFAQRLAVTGSLRPLGAENRSPLRIGFLTPLTGAEAEWGRQGIDGCRIWVDWINASGGLMVAGQRRKVSIVAHDSSRGAAETLEAAHDLVDRQRVKMVLTLGGDSIAPALPYLMRRRVLVSTLLPTDLSPDTPFLIAPAEVHPLFNVTGVDWLARTAPEARRISLCSQTDRLGLPSLAVYRAAFEAAGRDVVKEVRYAPDTTEADAIVAAMMAEEPDVLCWCSSAPPMIHALTEAAHARGFTGRILACTADEYPRLIARTSPAFMERYTFQFPDFDDPELADTAFFFSRPGTFFETYNRLFPGRWNAVSWEYASVLDLWHNAVEWADTTEPVSVLAAMKRRQVMPHAFGPARWWGAPLFGTDNALVGDWPVVCLRDGRARIVEFGSVLSWLERHEELLKRHMTELGQMWFQRIAERRDEPGGVTLPEAEAAGPRGA